MKTKLPNSLFQADHGNQIIHTAKIIVALIHLLVATSTMAQDPEQDSNLDNYKPMPKYETTADNLVPVRIS